MKSMQEANRFDMSVALVRVDPLVLQVEKTLCE
jgi:hypothetical protein